jgi:predicted metal-dependent enzyme (double-stranded beta helix superfamily)
VVRKLRRDITSRQIAYWKRGRQNASTPGTVDAVSPRIGDIHRVSSAFGDRTSLSIHVYGGNIGAVTRSVYPASGGRKTFISGYSNDVLPNIWNVSKESPIS